MSRVFLIEDNPRYPLDAAKSFGEITFVCDKMLNPFSTLSVSSLIHERLEHHGFDPEQDYICLTGQTLKVAMFLAVACAHYKTVRLLMFDAKLSAYRERLFDATATETAAETETATGV